MPEIKDPVVDLDDEDFVEARRGHLAGLPGGEITDETGRVVWSMKAYAFEAPGTPAPDTVNASLWRQAQLNTCHGLFQVTDRFYQVRGYDLSNMTIIQGDKGILVIDPLISTECARAALQIYRDTVNDRRPVTGVIYTHSHVDHFGGARGVLSDEDLRAGVPILAPEGFLLHAVSENIYAGLAMARRAQYMYGAPLPPGPRGQVDAGLGKAQSTGTVSLIPPTLTVGTDIRPGERFGLDGIDMIFQLTPGTEAPAEMNFFFPDFKALCAAENATHNLHNILTLRGAQVRDALGWSKYLDEAIELFGAGTEVLFAQHHWPRWRSLPGGAGAGGPGRVVEYLAKQRDLYRYLHDQTLRLLNRGYTGAEIAERIELPPNLAREWYCRGYYGTVSHNVKAIYQRYMGWYDGHPASLWALPPRESAVKYVEYMGGAEAVIRRVREAYARGEHRWVAEVLRHVVFADENNQAARELQADALEQLGFQAEAATWRNCALMGARELRGGITRVGMPKGLEVLAAMEPGQLFDLLGSRIDGPRAWDRRIVMNWVFTGAEPPAYRVQVENGALSYVAGKQDPGAAVTVTIDRAAVRGVLGRLKGLGAGALPQLLQSGAVRIEGAPLVLAEFFQLLDLGDPDFPIVTPRPAR